jgi:hypothetical protein
MKSNSEAMVMKIFIGSTDQYKQSPLYEHIVLEANKKGIAGATVTKGIMGYGASSIIHSYKFWEVNEKLPLVVELIDEEEKIMSFYETIRNLLESMKYGCTVTLEKTKILMYKSGKKRLFED